MSKEGLQPWEAIGKLAGGAARVHKEVLARAGELDLLERRGVGSISRRVLGLSLRRIKIEELPEVLKNPEERALVVSNYPSISKTFRGVLKLGVCLPGKELRIRGLGREEVKLRAGMIERVLGIDDMIFPVEDKTGVYRLDNEVKGEILSFLRESGSVLWMSPTGHTRGNGLLEEDIRTGAALFAFRNKLPIVPMGIVISEKGEVASLRFGEPIVVPQKPKGELLSDFLLDITRLAMGEIASLLPPGQRGDFENVEEKLIGVRTRLGFSS